MYRFAGFPRYAVDLFWQIVTFLIPSSLPRQGQSIREEDEHYGSSEGNIHEAVRSGRIEVVQSLVLEGLIAEADDTCNLLSPTLGLEKRDSVFGDTPLLLACRHDHTDIAKFLVRDCGANFEAKDNVGLTPLLLSASRGNFELVSFLLSDRCGADVKATDRIGETALHLSCMRDHLDVARLLLSKGGMQLAELPNRLNETPLSKACGVAKERMIQFLIEECNVKVESGDVSCLLKKVLYYERRELRRSLQVQYFEVSREETLTRRIDKCVKTLVKANPILEPTVVECMWNRSPWEVRMYWIGQYCEKVHGREVD